MSVAEGLELGYDALVVETKLQDEVREAVKQRADIVWLQNDCIYNAFFRASLSAAAVLETGGRLE